MWNKKIQLLFWSAAYFPVFIIAIYRYIFEGEKKYILLKINWIKKLYNNNFLSFKEVYLNNPELISVGVDCIAILIVIIITILIYKNGPNIIFRNIEKSIDKNDVKSSIRKFSKLSYNDYMFFLLTLILPLITVDFSKFVNLFTCLIVIFFIIWLLVNLNYIIACPLLIFSKYKIWIVDVVTDINGETQILENVFIITPVEDLYNKAFVKKQLLPRLYYLKYIEKSEE